MAGRYVELFASGELARRAEAALRRLSACDLCPRRCGVDRTGGDGAGRLGWCRTGRYAQVASYDLHFGEEAVLVGEGGSGTVFFAQCSLDCAFCQNWEISQGDGAFPEAGAEELARMFCELQARGAVNLNLVTPTHVAAQVLEALVAACAMGLDLPLVWNTSGYEELSTLRLLDGVVDVYMPDAKFWDKAPATRFCRAPDYPDAARAAIREMHRQVGDLALDDAGLAVSGLLVRHLVMPGDLAGSAAWLEFLSREISPDTYVNVMDQYRPCGQAHAYKELCRTPAPAEVAAARRAARGLGLRLDEGHERPAFALMRRLLREEGEKE
ncbi:radical SAM domain protein [Desulfovibrio sp. X2]|uniref:radical SAM domain protein n=1 Tax=Desulfovibrio sp. X2 TaxID=941449 RepID=UPI000358C291|nr:radical SAM domain protein [Desulfovibrio sp. X2]EPR39810.1 radical SAM domain protein [Desulfovibrio sp. X2]